MELLGLLACVFVAVWGIRKDIRLATEERQQRSLLALGQSEVPYCVPEGSRVLRRFLRSRWTLVLMLSVTLVWFLVPLMLAAPQWFQNPGFWFEPSVVLWAVPDFLRATSDVSVWRLGKNGWMVRGRIWPWEAVRLEPLHAETEGYILSLRPTGPARPHLPPTRVLHSDLDVLTIQFLDHALARR